MYRQNQVSKKVIENHQEIDSKQGSEAFKALCHYFEVTNNGGYWPGKHEGNTYELVSNLNDLDMTKDEQLCIDILKKHNKISMSKVLKQVALWNPDKQTQELGVEHGWSKNAMLGELWLCYRGQITTN